MIVYGKQIFRYVLQRHPELIQKVYLAKEIEGALFAKLKKLGVPIERVDSKKAQALARGGNHQGVLLDIEEFRFSDLAELKEERFLVVLVGVSDVGNIGSIVRSAYALGADGLVISGMKSLNMEGVIRRSSAAALDLPIALEPNVLDLMKELKDVGFRLYCADMNGEDVRKKRFEGKRAILLGSEGEGLPSKVVRRCDESLKIVMKRDFDSLNVAAAAAIFIDRMRDE